jgi:hypothetical protein
MLSKRGIVEKRIQFLEKLRLRLLICKKDKPAHVSLNRHQIDHKIIHGVGGLLVGYQRLVMETLTGCYLKYLSYIFCVSPLFDSSSSAK